MEGLKKIVSINREGKHSIGDPHNHPRKKKKAKKKTTTEAPKKKKKPKKKTSCRKNGSAHQKADKG